MSYPEQPSAYGRIGQSSGATTSASPIRDGITAAEQHLSDIQGTISELEKRLDTVLSPVPPAGPSVSDNPKSAHTSHIDGRLRILNEGFAVAVGRLRELINRIEV